MLNNFVQPLESSYISSHRPQTAKPRQHYLLRFHGSDRAALTDQTRPGQALARAVIGLEKLQTKRLHCHHPLGPGATGSRRKRGSRLLRQEGSRSASQPGGPRLSVGGKPHPPHPEDNGGQIPAHQGVDLQARQGRSSEPRPPGRQNPQGTSEGGEASSQQVLPAPLRPRGDRNIRTWSRRLRRPGSVNAGGVGDSRATTFSSNVEPSLRRSGSFGGASGKRASGNTYGRRPSDCSSGAGAQPRRS